MNAAEQQKATEAAQRRHTDVQERVIEAISGLLSKRASRKPLSHDRLVDLRITRADIGTLGPITARFAVGEKNIPDYEAAFERAMASTSLVTVDDLAAEIVRQLYPTPLIETIRGKQGAVIIDELASTEDVS
jgi:hypothetical protein